jgi:glycosyltransferase involved in cell wall biosynthesis
MDDANKKIRVCFISPKAYPIFNPQVESVFGGAEVDTYMIATELAKDRGFDVSFIVADYGQPQKEVRENVRILKSLNFKQNPLTGAREIWKALKRADADIYMMKTASAGVPLVQHFCRKYNKRFIYKTAHQRECDGSYLRQHPMLGRLFARSLKKAARVITQNQQDQDNLKQRFNIDSIVIANGHRIAESTESEKEMILWVGRSTAVKGPRRFLELAKALPQEPFVMICQRATGDTVYDDLKANAAKIDNVQFIERVPFGEVDHYFEKAKIFVNTSDSEGFPNTFIQACKASTAILSYAVNPDQFLDEQRCGMCCNTDMSTLITQLRKLLKDDLFKQFGRNGKKYVNEKHNIQTIIESYKAIFASG